MPRSSLNAFHLAPLRQALKPFRLHWYPTVGSTSTQAARLRRQGKLFAPAIVLTSHQTAGRGRGSNTWWSSNGTLTVTFALPMRAAPQELPILAGLALRDAVVELTGSREIDLKWPNDLLHNGRKLAGLLCERVDRVDLVGVGMNVNVRDSQMPRALRPRVTSLLEIALRPFAMTEVLILVAQHLQQVVRRRAEQPFAAFLREFQRHDALAGKEITVLLAGDETPVHGRCEGLDDSGQLLLRSRGSLLHIVAGQVIFNP